MADLLWFLSTGSVLLSFPQRATLVWLTLGHSLFQGLYLEETIILVLGIVLAGGFIRGMSVCSKQSLFLKCFVAAVIPLLLAKLAMLSLFLPWPILHREGDYGKLPIQSLNDLPELPTISKLICEGEFFKDEQGRVLLLRGVNLGGDTKVPVRPDGASWRFDDSFFDYKNVSFVGRPFPLEEADEHLGRLRAWGFTFLRFLVTWEAIEHEAPGVYDWEYLEYVRQVIRKCAEHGISVFVDPHQDVWSRWTGGDGAPAWTLEKAGFNISTLYRAGAAFTHQQYGDPLPRMLWPTNYHRLATATMFTLFFAGNTFAPHTLVEGVPIQDFLQNHFLAAVSQLAKVLKDEPNVLGFDTFNEPSNGYAGLADVSKLSLPALQGWILSPYQSMLLGAGISQDVAYFDKAFVFTRRDTLNPEGLRAWTGEDVWEREGVWGYVKGVPTCLRPSHFSLNAQGEPVDFQRDFMAPFFQKFERALHEINPELVIFVEPAMVASDPKLESAPTNVQGRQLAWAPHYYDVVALITKTSRPHVAMDMDSLTLVFGQETAKQTIIDNFGHIRRSATTLAGKGGPCLVGETGVPMDMDRDKDGMARAFINNDFSSQIRTMDRLMQGLEAHFLSYTLWNYAARNSNKRGDLWNDEDLSIFSREQQFTPYSPESVPITNDLYSGGRTLSAAVRPYPMKTAGIPVKLHFDMTNRTFFYEFHTQPQEEQQQQPQQSYVFVPKLQYPYGIECEVSDGHFAHDAKNHLLVYTHSPQVTTHTIKITPKSRSKNKQQISLSL